MAAGWVSGCANQGAPPGGAEDRRPPVVVVTEPVPFEVITALDRPVRFRFDERISEQVAGGTLDDAVTVSPRSGDVRVRHGSRDLSIEIEGGLRSGLVYRITLLPVVRDLFGNQLVDPFELVFSTGGEPTPTALAGEVWDRTTGQGLRSALVQASGADSLVYVARADDRGIFAFRYLPAGTFVVTGFEDLNRDGEVDAREVKGSVAATLAAGDTVLVDIPVLQPDTTPAVLARASALDSVTVVLELDDYLDPAAGTEGVGIALATEQGGAPAARTIFQEPDYAAYVARVTDSLTAAGATAAPGAPPPDAARGAPPQAPQIGPPQLPGARGRPLTQAQGTGAPGRVLPGRRLVALLDAPLQLDVEYTVRASEIVNINGVLGGGGEATFEFASPPPPPPPDTTAIPSDSLDVPTGAPLADTTIAPDTTVAPGGNPGLR